MGIIVIYRSQEGLEKYLEKKNRREAGFMRDRWDDWNFIICDLKISPKRIAVLQIIFIIALLFSFLYNSYFRFFQWSIQDIIFLSVKKSTGLRRCVCGWVAKSVYMRKISQVTYRGTYIRWWLELHDCAGWHRIATRSRPWRIVISFESTRKAWKSRADLADLALRQVISQIFSSVTK